MPRRSSCRSLRSSQSPAWRNYNDAVLAAVLESVACDDRPLERVDVSDAEVVVIAKSDLGVGAGSADRGDLGLGEQIAGSDGAAGAISTDNNGDIIAYKKLSRGGSLGCVGCVIRIDELYIVSLAVNINSRIERVGILDTENFLLAAGGI